MIYVVEIHEVIEDEVAEIAAWYELRKKGESKKFYRAFYNGIESIRIFPLKHRTSEFGPRRAMMPSYPYHIYFDVSSNLISIRAIIHVKRNPDWIKTRFG